MVVEQIADSVGAQFVALTQQLLGATGWQRPAVGQACVLLFDSQPWVCHAASASLLLEPFERERAARFRFERDRIAYTMAHAMWRLLLANTLHVGVDEVPLRSTPSGQPILPNTGVATSLSHSGSWVAIAVGQLMTLGVDIELSPSPHTLGDLLETICTPREAVGMRRLPEVEREAALLALWTRKEALLKAFGTGLGTDPANLSGAVDQPIEAPIGSSFPACRVHSLHCLDISPVVVGALAVPVGVSDGRLFVITGMKHA
ncbi:MAG: 4'-phosphopantetheinyl transferase superfamily protein [Rhodanobacter sp.]